jgi:hypothetical protein
VTGVTVTELIYEQQCVKTVITPEGEVRGIPPGQVPEPEQTVLAKEGEPAFLVRLADEVRTDDDVPDEVGFALRKAAQRFFEVQADGREVPDETGPVEWIIGPAVHDGAIVIYLDTDNSWSSRAMFDTIVGILVEELASLSVQAEIAAAPPLPSPLPANWMSRSERERI